VIGDVRLKASDLHWPLIAVAAFIALLGVYNVHSAAAARDASLYLSQVYWLLIGVVVVTVSLYFDYRVSERFAYPAYAVVCLLLLAVLATHHGRAAKGAERWLVLGPLSFQPSELAKLATVLCLANYFGGRADEGGYTLTSLLRPLNLSRPLAVLAALVVFWQRDWLADPVGLLARFLRQKLGGDVPAVADLYWLRALLAIGVFALIGLAAVAVLRAERQVALLSPWPPGRKQRLLFGVGVLGVSLFLGLAWVWSAPLLRDPFGVAVSALVTGAAPGGPYAVANPNSTLRLVAVAALAVYLLAALRNLTKGVLHPIDLMLAPIDLVAAPTVLILVQPDLGTAGIVVLIGMTMVLVVGVKLRSLIILGLCGALVAGVGWFGILKEYQKNRILTFIDPEHDMQGAGWNAVQSMIAVGSGQWVGKGHKGGTQTQLAFLPEQHTDFAFSVWGEEQGFVGCVLLVSLYVAFIWLALAIAAEARDRYGALLATGALGIILWQALINVSMVIGMFPVVGITLPLFSYGGSSALTVLLSIGILLNVHWRRRVHY